jgi:hypothetical protein
MLKKSSSKFDTGNWSEVNGLPGQQDIMNFLEFLTSSDPNKCYTRRDLMDEVAKEFEIPTVAIEAEGPKSTTPGYYTRLTYLISDGIQGKRRAEGNPFMKRIAPACYQHITGNGVVSKEFKNTRTSRRGVSEAMASVKILQSLNWDEERIYNELAGQNLCGWSDADIEAAIEKIFNPAE